MAYDYFYDGQIRRFLLQIVRAFSGFQYQVAGRNGNGPEFRVVPCRMALMNRQIAQIMKQNSENTLLTVPMISVWIKEMATARDRTQAPGFVSTVQVTEREFDEDTQTYNDQKGNSFTVERVMPHPLDLTIQVDIWTSNEHQKHQIWEQIYMLFNVGFDIQSSENPLDWTALTTMLMDSIQWTSRSIPVGTQDEIDVASFTFKLPVWITPPAKVKQQKLIQQVVTNIYGTGSFEDSDSVDGPLKQGVFSDPLGDAVIVTPDDARIQIENGEITLLDKNGEGIDWLPYLGKLGQFTSNQTQLRLRAHIEQDETLDIIGTLQPTSDASVMVWMVDIDTLPSNTMPPVTAIIDPMKHYPGGVLDTATNNQRYMITNDMGPSQAWRNFDGTMTLTAYTGDIIEYQNGVWVKVFDASAATTIQFMVNLRSGKQLKFVDGTWIMAIDGLYNPGFWRIRF